MTEKSSRPTPLELMDYDLYAADRQCVAYLKALETVRGNKSLKEWNKIELAKRRWMVAEEILQAKVSDCLIEARLFYVDMALADLLPEGYNSGQVARDSDGQIQPNEA